MFLSATLTVQIILSKWCHKRCSSTALGRNIGEVVVLCPETPLERCSNDAVLTRTQDGVLQDAENNGPTRSLLCCLGNKICKAASIESEMKINYQQMWMSMLNHSRDKSCQVLPVETVDCHMRLTATGCQTTAAFPLLWPWRWQHCKLTTNIKTEHSMLIFISTICQPADLNGGHLSRDKPLFVKTFNQARLKDLAAFCIFSLFPPRQLPGRNVHL